MSRRGSRHKNFTDVHGILLVDKPAGITSNQTLQKVRHLLKANKAGHTGNLDPMATGLLPCCFGDATKVADLMINADKAYQATAVLGAQTDSGDATGSIQLQKPVPVLDAQKIQFACNQLMGDIQQIPPMYSALHHKGQRLYDLARQGIEVDRPARKVTIYKFEYVSSHKDKQLQTVTFNVHCSKGTYIRTLIEDWAIKLNTLAHLNALRRTQSGIFKADQMQTLAQLESSQNPHQYLLPADAALTEYPAIQLNKQQATDLIHGKQTAVNQDTGMHRLYDDAELFMGMGKVFNNHLRVHKLFMKSYQQSLAQRQ
ncbi:tRNA pseudouridine(55) synthase TruB [Marinicella gelatinilytica]|uniref:tRNA pseudouridine(55) synthase TruB n=1 Tax=Marinicella gelatinilytica TaxID=2996017 RepID=UPI002260A1DE|nr:tRNA pseudouridine(55) synthase TruB [Marinicella gelatinilytica]MCX7544995.1 tRNA pseudouridine(55) synthase TruB [Marinicella gelatinilytica]